MAAEGMNCITKWGIMIISVALAVFLGITLVRRFMDSQDYDSDKIIDILIVLVGLILAVLAFWGAFTENSCLCYIALGVTVVVLAVSVWSIINCAISDKFECEAIDYASRIITLVICVVMVFLVYTFIQSIK